MRVRLIPILKDNFSFLLVDDDAGVGAVVDPAEPEPVLAAVREEGVRLTHVLATHHHWDHTAGNEAVKAAHPQAEVVGGRIDGPRIPGLTRPVDEGDTVAVGGLEGKVLFVPCHTKGHIAYVFGDALFCGDMLFVGGCGRFFEGGGAEMWDAMQKFMALPDETRVFCGHEYTVSNLQFARSVDGDNPAVREKLAWAEAERKAGRPTVPSTIGDEKRYNPFMRVTEPALIEAVGGNDPVEVMTRLREAKNQF